MSDTRAPGPCKKCRGRGWYIHFASCIFGPPAIKRCDLCGRFASDDAAASHITDVYNMHDDLLAACEAGECFIASICDVTGGKQTLETIRAALAKTENTK